MNVSSQPFQMKEGEFYEVHERFNLSCTQQGCMSALVTCDQKMSFKSIHDKHDLSSSLN